MIRSKTVKVLYIVLFTILVLLPVPIFSVVHSHVDTQNYEQRTLYPLPFTREASSYYGTASTADTFPKQFEDWFNDHLPFRNQMLTLNSLFDYRVLRTSSSENVVVGKEGWLFYKGSQVAGEDPVADYSGGNLFTEEELQKIAANFTAARDTLAAQGKTFYIYIAPNKERVYSEYMPDSFGQPAENCRMNQIVRYLRENTDLNVICSYDALMSYKAAHPDHQVYLKYDTHWNYLGAYVGVQPLIEAAGFDFVPVDQVTLTERGEKGSYDLARLIHLGNILNDDHYYLVNGYTPHPMETASADDGKAFYYRTTDGQAPGGKVFIIGDSFSTLMAPYLACHYFNGYMTFYYNYSYEQLGRENPDTVVYETVERYIGNMLDFTLEGGYTGEVHE